MYSSWSLSAWSSTIFFSSRVDTRASVIPKDSSPASVMIASALKTVVTGLEGPLRERQKESGSLEQPGKGTRHGTMIISPRKIKLEASVQGPQEGSIWIDL